ncbi:PASTA domain-containing protein, partial [Streptomyces sp. SID1328]|uniref:Stk1 family PASTA domain-containing Ser/Thr kinase n=1 Tax=Streptomyces sp. SID1328 TaxID=2690250 RepID=UPI00136AB0AE
TEEQLDALPPQALSGAHDNAGDRTSVLPRAMTVRPLPVDGDGEDGRDVTSVLHTTDIEPPPARRGTGRSRRPRRGLLTLLAAVLVVLGVGGGVWYINSGQFTKVPPVLSRTQDQAEQRLKAAGLEVGGVQRAYSDTVDRGTVISTDPSAGSRVRGHASVRLTVSLGPRTVAVPRVAGQPLERARERLKAAGLEPGMVTREFSDEAERGSVIRTTPEAGTERHAGSAIALVVSKGAPVDIPDVSGEDAESARQDLTDAGLKVKIAAERVNSDYDKGQVVSQSPEPGTWGAEGDTVTLTLSKGPEMVKVPDVVGSNVDDAHQKLEAAGFEVREDRGLLGLFGDTVKKQSVAGGDRAPKGSEVTITIR